jgi:hypothetical protein
MIPETWQAVERADGETVGYVAPADGETLALDLLGSELGRAASAAEARGLVVERGLASLARFWDWTDAAGVTRRVHVVHVRPGLALVRTGGTWVGSDGETFEVELPVVPGSFRPA